MSKKSDALARAKRVLDLNRENALKTIRTAGEADTHDLLVRAQRDLNTRIRETQARGLEDDTFTMTQLRVMLTKVEEVTRQVANGIQSTVLNHGKTAASAATRHSIRYLVAADKAFRGLGEQPLALKEASMMSHVRHGVKASILRRIAGNEEEGHLGILQRYGVETIGEFETELRVGLLTGKTHAQMVHAITKKSHFLQHKPAHWAHRIVRTELMGAYNRGHLEATKAAHKQLGDMVNATRLNPSPQPQCRATPNKRSPLGEHQSARSDERGGHQSAPDRAAPSKNSPLGGQRSTRSDERGGHITCA